MLYYFIVYYNILRYFIDCVHSEPEIVDVGVQAGFDWPKHPPHSLLTGGK